MSLNTTWPETEARFAQTGDQELHKLLTPRKVLTALGWVPGFVLEPIAGGKGCRRYEFKGARDDQVCNHWVVVLVA